MTAPHPPADLNSRNPLFVELAAGTRLHRFYTAAYEPIFFDRSADGRLNDIRGEYGVLYTAENRDGAFAESFLRRQLRMLDAGFIAKKGYVELEARSDLKLFKLAGHGLARIGATAEVTHGGAPYSVPQQWSRQLHDLPLGADGIAYYARHDDEQLCFAVFERAQPKIREISREIDLLKPWFWDLLEKYDVAFTT